MRPWKITFEEISVFLISHISYILSSDCLYLVALRKTKSLLKACREVEIDQVTPDHHEFSHDLTLTLVWAIKNLKNLPYSLYHLLAAILEH